MTRAHYALRNEPSGARPSINATVDRAVGRSLRSGDGLRSHERPHAAVPTRPLGHGARQRGCARPSDGWWPSGDDGARHVGAPRGGRRPPPRAARRARRHRPAHRRHGAPQCATHDRALARHPGERRDTARHRSRCWSAHARAGARDDAGRGRDRPGVGREGRRRARRYRGVETAPRRRGGRRPPRDGSARPRTGDGYAIVGDAGHGVRPLADVGHLGRAEARAAHASQLRDVGGAARPERRLRARRSLLPVQPLLPHECAALSLRTGIRERRLHRDGPALLGIEILRRGPLDRRDRELDGRATAPDGAPQGARDGCAAGSRRAPGHRLRHAAQRRRLGGVGPAPPADLHAPDLRPDRVGLRRARRRRLGAGRPAHDRAPVPRRRRGAARA